MVEGVHSGLEALDAARKCVEMRALGRAAQALPNQRGCLHDNEYKPSVHMHANIPMWGELQQM